MMDALEEMQRTLNSLQKEVTALQQAHAMLTDRFADALTLVKLQKHQLTALRKRLKAAG